MTSSRKPNPEIRDLDARSVRLAEDEVWGRLSAEERDVWVFAAAFYSLTETDQRLAYGALDGRATLKEQGKPPQDIQAYDEAQSVEVKAALAKLSLLKARSQGEARKRWHWSPAPVTKPIGDQRT